MSPRKGPVRVTIFGQSYTIRADGDPVEVERVAQEIDELMTVIAARGATTDPARVAVMACLELADRLRALERRVKRKGRELSLALEEALGGEDGLPALAGAEISGEDGEEQG